MEVIKGPETSPFDSRTKDVKEIARVISKKVGSEVLANLHRRNGYYDFTACTITLAVFILNAIYLVDSKMSVFWFVSLLFQGFVLQIFGLLNHDVFSHRKFGGKIGSGFYSMIYCFPLFMKPTTYTLTHSDHHDYLGQESDTENYKQDLDTRAKKLFFLTGLGLFLGMTRRLSRNKPSVSSENGYFRDRRQSSMYSDSFLKIETGLFYMFFIALVGLFFIFPKELFFGYILPLTVAMPIANTFRTILEHAEANPKNPAHIGTFYKTGLISQVLFFWDAGDCHIIHHLFPMIPFYNIRKTLKVINPHLVSLKVKERKNLWQLVAGWFAQNQPHRQPWLL